MDNTEKPETKKAAIGWLFILGAVVIIGYMLWSWNRQRAINKQMEKVRAARGKEEPVLNLN